MSESYRYPTKVLSDYDKDHPAARTAQEHNPWLQIDLGLILHGISFKLTLPRKGFMAPTPRSLTITGSINSLEWTPAKHLEISLSDKDDSFCLIDIAKDVRFIRITGDGYCQLAIRFIAFSGFSSQKLTALQRSTSQFAQDVIALQAHNYKRNGYFVEIGAAGGVLDSNCYLLEHHFDWTGIAVEADPRKAINLQSSRKCILDFRAISSCDGEKLQFASLGGMATLCNYLTQDVHGQMRLKQVDANPEVISEVTTVSLNSLLKEHNAPANIDFISLDTEGSEYDILKTFDFNAYNVNMWIIEHNYSDKDMRLKLLMEQNGYIVTTRGVDYICCSPNISFDEDDFVGIARNNLQSQSNVAMHALTNDDTNKVAIIIPIKIDYHVPGRSVNLLTRLTKVLLPSISKFASSTFSRVLIITKDDEHDTILNAINSCHFQQPEISLLRESAILPLSSDMSISGWFLQQMLKLKISEFIDENYYLILDADCFLRANISLSDIIREDGILTNVRPFRWNNGKPDVNKWYYSTCDTFGLDLTQLATCFDPKIVFGVTPNLMITKYVREAIKFFQTLSGQPSANDFFLFLCNKTKNERFECTGWTEYTLYWLYLVLSGNLHRYRTSTDIKLARQEVWTIEQFRELTNDGGKSLFNVKDRTFFISLIQSAIPDISDKEVLISLSPWLENQHL